MSIAKLDAHQHFWQLSQPFDYRWLDDPKLARIRRDYLPADLKPHLDAHGTEGSIFVQTQHDLAENLWVLEMCRDNAFVKGVVGWVDLASPDCGDQLARMRQHSRFVGVRHVVQDEPDDDFLIRPDILRGLATLEKAGVPFDVLIFVKHLKHVPTLARRMPQLKMVIDHLAKPAIAHGGFSAWREGFAACGAFPNVFCKLSGMVTEADWANWSPADLKPYIDEALEVFGPDRLMYGSDWPVCELAASYGQLHDALESNLAGLTDSEKSAIFARTGKAFYALPD
ncbi:amidohydrolase family protein [bacterium]|nr:amidohydrolase family protein [bacterium]